MRLQPDGTGVAPRLGLQPLAEDLRDLLVRAVLQQPGEEQVPGLEQREVRLVLHLGGGQQPGRLEVEQGGGDDQELGGLVEVPVGPHGPDVRHELVGDLGQRDLGDVQLVLGDQLEQQVEGPLEVGEPHGEPPVVDRVLAAPAARPAGGRLRPGSGPRAGSRRSGGRTALAGGRGSASSGTRPGTGAGPRRPPASVAAASGARPRPARRARGSAAGAGAASGPAGCRRRGRSRPGPLPPRAAAAGLAGRSRAAAAAAAGRGPGAASTAVGRSRTAGHAVGRARAARRLPSSARAGGVRGCSRRRGTPGPPGPRRPPRGRSARGRRPARARRAAPAGRAPGP